EEPARRGDAADAAAARSEAWVAAGAVVEVELGGSRHEERPRGAADLGEGARSTAFGPVDEVVRRRGGPEGPWGEGVDRGGRRVGDEPLGKERLGDRRVQRKPVERDRRAAPQCADGCPPE